MTAKIDMNFETNAKQTAQDVGALGDKIDKTGKKAGQVGKNFSGLKGKIMSAFGPLVVGGAIAKGIKAMVDDLTQIADRTKDIAKATRELRGLAGQGGVDRMNRLAKEMEYDKIALNDLLSASISGGAGMTEAEQDQLVREAILMERGKGMPAVEAVKFGASVFNADPEYFRKRAGVTGAINQVATTAEFAKMTQLEGRAMIPAISEASSAGIPTAQGSALFASISQVQEPFIAGTISKAIIKGFASNRVGNEGLVEFINRVNNMPASDKTQMVGQGASGIKTFLDNFGIYEKTLRKANESASGRSIPLTSYQEALKDPNRAFADIEERSKARSINEEVTAKELKTLEVAKYELDESVNEAKMFASEFARIFVAGSRQIATFGLGEETLLEQTLTTYRDEAVRRGNLAEKSGNEALQVNLRKTAVNNRRLSEGN